MQLLLMIQALLMLLGLLMQTGVMLLLGLALLLLGLSLREPLGLLGLRVGLLHLLNLLRALKLLILRHPGKLHLPARLRLLRRLLPLSLRLHLQRRLLLLSETLPVRVDVKLNELLHLRGKLKVTRLLLPVGMPLDVRLVIVERVDVHRDALRKLRVLPVHLLLIVGVLLHQPV